ncbi:hypothetical protein [Pseudomonas sp. GM80]|uniref:hypothetical protein n=1 Tax=Pseudomonas sp. GM80 TaxID=1144339 RepID=UPI00026F4E48|nr:hypothetical protein [Pseudomonas sp. GM80]EJN34414.1 hypothetical protein PMI37_01274 [Pseudomonas sp. GM80]
MLSYEHILSVPMRKLDLNFCTELIGKIYCDKIAQVRCIQAIHIFDSFFTVIDQAESDLPNTMLMAAFVGYMATDTDISKHFAYEILQQVWAVFEKLGLLEANGFKEVQKMSMDVCISAYSRAGPATKLLERYSGHKVVSRDNEEFFIDLIEIDRSFGEPSTSYIHSLIVPYAKNLNSYEIKTNVALISAIISGLSRLTTCRDLRRIKLSPARSGMFIGDLKRASLLQTQKAGLPPHCIELNWIFIRDVIEGFFFPSGILRSSFASKRLLSTRINDL